MFCKYCGRQIKDGEICQCQKGQAAQQSGAKKIQTSQKMQKSQKSQKQSGEKTPKSGKGLFITSVIFSIIAVITFILLRFVLADTLYDILSDIYTYLIYIIPGIFGVLACLLAIFSFQDKRIRMMSIIAVIAGILVTAVVVVSMVAFPYEQSASVSEDDEEEDEDDEDTEDDKDTDEKNEDTEESDEAKDTDEREESSDSDLADIQKKYDDGKIDYAQAKDFLNKLDVDELEGEDASAVITFQEKIEEDLAKSMNALAKKSKYMEIFSQLSAIEDVLSEDQFVQSLKEKYEPDFIMYLDEESKNMASNDQKDEAVDMLNKAKDYLSEASIAEDLIEDVEEMAAKGGYILPESNSRYLTKADVDGLSLREINYAKNEIYARHGRRFNSNELQTYFDSQSWYNGTISPSSFNSSVFNAYEKKNVQFLSDIEFSRQSGGYKLDEK